MSFGSAGPFRAPRRSSLVFGKKENPHLDSAVDEGTESRRFELPEDVGIVGNAMRKKFVSWVES